MYTYIQTYIQTYTCTLTHTHVTIIYLPKVILSIRSFIYTYKSTSIDMYTYVQTYTCTHTHYHNLLISGDTIHKRQHLRNNTFLGLAIGLVTFRSDGIHLINPDNRRLILLRLLEAPPQMSF